MRRRSRLAAIPSMARTNSAKLEVVSTKARRVSGGQRRPAACGGRSSEGRLRRGTDGQRPGSTPCRRRRGPPNLLKLGAVAVAPLTFSRYIVAHRAALSCATWLPRSWASVETRAYP
jgi:hypothetical protein